MLLSYFLDINTTVSTCGSTGEFVKQTCFSMREWRDLFIKFAMSCFSFFITKEFIFKNRHKKSTARCNFKRENLRITTKKASFCLQKNGRGERIRTFGLMVPNHARYQAAPHPDVLTTIYNIPALKIFVKYFFKNFLKF